MLSDFLKINGGLELKKACRIRDNAWEIMINNQGPPTIKMFHRIVEHLSQGNGTKKKAFTNALWKEILNLRGLPRTINMKIVKKPMPAPRRRFQMSGRYPRVYNPPKYTQWKREFAILVGDMGTIVGPCKIKVEYHESSKTLALGPHQKKGDIDNFDKAFLDALQMNGLLEDDKDVFSMESTKYTSFDDFVQFTIWFDELWPNEKGLV